jgi:sulfur transfer protein SufE
MILKTQRMNSYSNSLRLVVTQTKNMETAEEKTEDTTTTTTSCRSQFFLRNTHQRKFASSLVSRHTWEISRIEKRKLETFQKKKLILK